MYELLLASTLLAQRVGPGYVGLPPQQTHFKICLNDPRPSSYVNLRSRPTARSQSLGKLNHNEGVDIVSRGAGPDDGMWWAYVRLTNGGTGYVRDDYVCVR